MFCLRRSLARLSFAMAAAALLPRPAVAQGIPVIDTANLAQTIQQVANDITSIQNQVQQITQLQAQINSLNGMRGLGTILNNPLLKNYVPPEAYNVVNAVNVSGYSGLSATAKALRDVGMVYNCADRTGDARLACQSTLAQPYQHKGLLQDAMRSAAGRLNQIQALMGQIDATTDQKSVQEIQARIGAENALLAHELSQLQMLQGLADSEERIARSRERERQYEMLSRTGRIADYLP
ncbi:type IV secretion system protein [Aquincola tertiaricarbonis]|uniref:type IV secretion system protein n=1 Tax=Aquincola tertiaricarbonis TaxID=391953 RepID=UPI0009FA0A26|nr:type IV secretion system protein [Aquincola tertiaricarbonis]